MIFHEQPTDPWVPFDFILLEAYQMLQDEICPKCGHPVWLCRSDSASVQFKVRSAVCNAERELKIVEDRKRPDKEREKDKKVRAGWGEFYYTQPFVPENIGGEMPTRGEFYASLMASD